MLMTRERSTGLCSTCNNAAFCQYLKNRGYPALQCEEHDHHEPVARKGSSCDPTLAARPEEGDGHLSGLCVNCENRHSCSYGKAQGGVWHCEEYR